VLRGHTWPGNVRELKNTLASALAFVDGPTLEPRHLQLIARPADTSQLEHLPLGGQTLESLERAAIKQTLTKHGGQQGSVRASARH